MSKLQNASQGYTFDDFVLVPLYSTIKSRQDPDISVNLPGFKYDIPIVSSPMNTVTESDMLVAMWQLGGVGVLHRYMSVRSQAEQVAKTISRLNEHGKSWINRIKNPPFYVAVGANGDLEKRVEILEGVGVTGFCIDVANGHNELSIEAVRTVRRLVPDAHIMAGNVCTFRGAYKLASAGANSIRVGIGGGSVCKTRQVTGHGVPQLTAIEDCIDIKNREVCLPFGLSSTFPDVTIIADGGIRNPGDIVKSLAIGADAVMIGGLLAGTSETPGKLNTDTLESYKLYSGMASKEARNKWDGGFRGDMPAEGVSIKVPYRGNASDIINDLASSVKVGLSYSGASNVKELREKARWVRVTGAGYVEGTPHGK